MDGETVERDRGCYRAWLVWGLGGCPRCMRWSLLAAVAAWVLFGGVSLLGAMGVVRWAFFTLALGASLWWLAHWGAYVGKRCLVEAYLVGNPWPASGEYAEVLPRRRWLSRLWRYATLGLAGTLLGWDRAWGQVVPCGFPMVLLVAPPTEECARDLSDAFRRAVLTLQAQSTSFADFLCTQRSQTCGRRRCQRIAARNPEDIRPEIRLVANGRGQRLWCVRCVGRVRVICGCV